MFGTRLGTGLSRHGVYCGRRVGVLYRAPWADYYGCRHCYNLSYESRNESRHGRLAFIGHVLTLARRVKKLREQRRRWTYRGMPTRKAQRLHILEARLDACSRPKAPVSSEAIAGLAIAASRTQDTRGH